MIPSFAEATAAARRIAEHHRVLHSNIGESRFERDARLLAAFVLAGTDTERLREALETERERIRQRPSHGPERDAYNNGASFGLSFALGALDALDKGGV